MQVIRTRSFAVRLRRMAFWFLTGFVLLVAVTAVWADEPPTSLFKQVTETSQLVHKGTCNVKSMHKVETPCLIYAGNSLLWIVLFDQNRQGDVKVSHVVLVKDAQESLAWCRHDICL